MVESLSHGTLGYFVTNYLAGNGRSINIIRQLSVNDNVQFLGLYDQSWGSGFQFFSNLLDHVEATGWGGSNNYSKNWGGRFNDANSITNFA